MVTHHKFRRYTVREDSFQQVLYDIFESVFVVIGFVLIIFTLGWSINSDAGIPKFDGAKQNEVDVVDVQKIRIACVVFTYKERHRWTVLQLRNTWTRHCDRVLFVSNELDDFFEPVVFESKMTRYGMEYLYRYYRDEADWFVRAEDNTFVVVENLRHLLSAYSPQEPIFFGCKLKNAKGQVYMHGGSGYVLSKAALHRYATLALPNNTICHHGEPGWDSEQMSECLRNVGVTAGDSRDAEGRETFIPFSPIEAFGELSARKQEWYSKHSFYNSGNFTKEMISPHTIAFSDASPGSIKDLYFFIYKLRKFGRKRSKAILPLQSTLL